MKRCVLHLLPVSDTTSPSATKATDNRPSYRDGDNNQHENKWYPDHAVPSGATKGSLKNTPEFKFDWVREVVMGHLARDVPAQCGASCSLQRFAGGEPFLFRLRDRVDDIGAGFR